MAYEIRKKKGNYLLKTPKVQPNVALYGFDNPNNLLFTPQDNNLSTQAKIQFQLEVETPQNQQFEVELYVVSDLQPTFERSIIIRESATGDGGFVIDNGRLQQSITINGELLAATNEELMNYEKQILDLQGQVIEFIPKKFNSRGLSNKFFIQSFNPTYSNASDISMPFTMVLQEYRQVNVTKTQTELLNFNTSQQLIDLWKSVKAFGTGDTVDKSIAYQNTEFTETIGEFTNRFGIQIKERRKEFRDPVSGELIASKWRGYSLDSNNRLGNAALNIALGLSMVALTPFIRATDIPDDEETIEFTNGTEAVMTPAN